jgi:hypothetical protein
LLVLSNPAAATPADAADQAKTGKLVLMILGNMGGNEWEGTEASLALAREILTTQSHPLLKDIVLLLAPMLNPDEAATSITRTDNLQPRRSPREEAAQLDLNRDYIKLETLEIRALVRALTLWNPAMVLDLHTAQEATHRYDITYDGPNVMASHPEVLRYVNEVFLPEVSKRYQAKTGRKSFYHGRFNTNRTAWITNPALARFGVPYLGLRGQLGIYVESNALGSFQNRVRSTVEYIRTCLDYASSHKEQIRHAALATDNEAKEIRQAAFDPSPSVPKRIAIRSKPAAAPETAHITRTFNYGCGPGAGLLRYPLEPA